MLFHLVFPKGPIDFSSVNLHPHWWQDYITDGYLWYGINVKNSSTRIWEVVWHHLGVNLMVISLSGELMKPVFRLTWILKSTLSSWLINICVVLINQLQLLTFWAYLLTQILHFESLNNLRCVWDQFWLNEIHRQWLIEYRITSSAWIAWNMVYFHSMPWTTLLWEPPWLPRGRVPALQTFAPGRTWITTGCTKSCLPGTCVTITQLVHYHGLCFYMYDSTNLGPWPNGRFANGSDDLCLQWELKLRFQTEEEYPGWCLSQRSGWKLWGFGNCSSHIDVDIPARKTWTFLVANWICLFVLILY